MDDRSGRDPLRRARHPAAGADAVDPEGAGRDRRPADPLARDPDLRRAGLRRFLLLTGYRASRSRSSSPATRVAGAGRGRVRRHRPRHADRRADRGRARTGSAAGPSAPPTPTASPTSTSPRCSPSTASHGALGDDDRRAARAASSASPSSTATDRVAGFDEKPRLEHWINGGFFCFEPGVLDYLERGQRARARAAASGWPPTASCAPTATRASGTAWTPTRTRSCSTTSGQPASAPWAVWERRSAAPVTRRWSPAGAGSSAPGWRKALLERGDAVVLARPRRRRGRASGLDAAGDRRRGRADVDGRPARRASCVGARSSSTRSTPSSTSPRRRSSAPRPRPRCRPSRRTSAAPGRCSRPAASAGVERVVVASSDKAYGASTTSCPTARTSPLRAAYPYDVEQGGGRPDRAQLLARLRAAGGGDPVRQHLRRRRPQLLAADPGGGQRRARRPPPGDPLRRLPRARLPLRRGRGRAPTWRSRDALDAGGAARARPSTPAASGRTRSREVVELIAELGRRRASSPTSGATATRPARSTASTSTRPSCAS